METRANFVLIGLFTVIVAVGLLVFATWMSAPERTVDPMLLYVVFEGQAQGIRVGSDALFNGIKVGDVKKIEFDPDNPRLVRVLIAIERDTPIRSDVKASIQAVGITGTSAVALTLGPGPAPPFVIVEGEVPVIDGDPPMLKELMNNLPLILSNANSLLDRLNGIMEENRPNILGITSDVHELTSAIVDYKPTLDRSLAHLEETLASTDAFMGRLDTYVENDGDDVIQSLREVLEKAQTTLDSWNALANRTDALVADNEPAVDAFASQGLAQVGAVVADLRRLLASLERIALKIENDPSGFVFGGAQTQEYTTP